MARNKYSKMKADDRQQDRAQRKGQPTGIDIIVTDDDVDMSAETERLWNEEAQRRVAAMRTADEVEAEAEAKAESAPETKSEADTKSETKPQSKPEAKAAQSKPQKDSDPELMTGIVTEPPVKTAPKKPETQPKPEPKPAPASKPQPRPTVTPEQLRQHRGVEVSDEIYGKFINGDFDEDLAEYRAEQRVIEDEIAFLRKKERERQAKIEAAKWKTVIVVKVDDKWRFFVDAYRAAATAIDAIPGIDSKMKANMKSQAREELYNRAEARQRHCESGEVRRYESSDLAEIKKEEWRDAWAKQKAKKKDNSAGKPAK